MSDNTVDRLERIDFHGSASLDFDTITFLVLSSILASVALLADSTPVLIGSMVLAPSFDTIVAIPFGIINRDWQLVRTGTTGLLVHSVVIFVVSFITVWVLLHTPLIPPSPALAGRGLVSERLLFGGYSIITALAAGAGGSIATVTNRRENIVGVVIALAIVPALAAASIGFQAGPLSGWGGIMLFAINVSGIIVAGFVVLMIRMEYGKTKKLVKEHD
ncbi:putative membrane protein [Candidatus Methanoperedens nitroreducens]|uniref:Putative membrane protein n=1 Tax=Candidatus Methanoperedens nitratireducens TaxID=1392998 RepID=A0A062VBN9_9EURY|nr:DUF389 domain-containing protein [Candidatus Methanoperedens nitroreducens]KCZ73114.1 putative membrane protein [Candidatus Methanoperedens nitroreducens]MDJ1422939.1 DUF389 domain-containing protein [Candidatus Methanoperedens sp.]